MNWFKIAKYLLIAEVALVTFIVLYILKIALAQSIGIGVMPAVLKYNFPGVYEHEFCFFNKGDTDAVYSIQSGDIRVLTEINFTVPAGSDIDTCVKKKIKFVADKTGYFYISAFPEEMPEGAIQLIRRIGVKIEVLSPTTTTVQQGGAGGGGGVSGSTGELSSGNISEANITTTTTAITTIQNISMPQSEYNASANISAQETLETSEPQVDYSSIIKTIIIAVIVIISLYVLIELLALK